MTTQPKPDSWLDAVRANLKPMGEVRLEGTWMLNENCLPARVCSGRERLGE